MLFRIFHLIMDEPKGASSFVKFIRCFRRWGAAIFFYGLTVTVIMSSDSCISPIAEFNTALFFVSTCFAWKTMKERANAMPEAFPIIRWILLWCITWTLIPIIEYMTSKYHSDSAIMYITLEGPFIMIPILFAIIIFSKKGEL